MTRECLSYRDPFAWGEPIETLYYIPPTSKGGASEGIAGVTCQSGNLYSLTPRERVYKECSMAGPLGGRHV